MGRPQDSRTLDIDEEDFKRHLQQSEAEAALVAAAQPTPASSAPGRGRTAYGTSDVPQTASAASVLEELNDLCFVGMDGAESLDEERRVFILSVERAADLSPADWEFAFSDYRRLLVMERVLRDIMGRWRRMSEEGGR